VQSHGTELCLPQEEDPEEDTVKEAQDAAEEAAGGLRSWFGSAARKSKVAVEVCGC
jgi:hypothetical protein